MIRILVFPTSTPEATAQEEQRGVPIQDFAEFYQAACGMSEYGEVRVTVHGKDLRATVIQEKPTRRGIGNNR